MNRAVVKHTQVAYHLSLIATVKRNGKTHTFNRHLVTLTAVIFWLWSIRELVNRQLELVQGLGEVAQALTMAANVYLVWLEIVVKAVAFGIGVKL